MTYTAPLRFRTISEFHQFKGLPSPEHPLVSLIDLSADCRQPEQSMTLTLDFYSIALKRNFGAKIRYGQQEYDFDEGILFFIAPGQVYRIEPIDNEGPRQSGWMLLIHPDFLWNTPLAKTIRQYEYFDYSVHQALFLSEKEETVITGIMQQIQQEYHSNIDQFSQQVIIAQLCLLLTYGERFYNRQFLTRSKAGHQVLERLEKILSDYLGSDAHTAKGLPTVQYVADALHMSPTYLSAQLKALTGQSTQQHIHEKLIEKAKEKLSTTNLSVSEIAYELGFEHPQSFSKLFRSKTQLSPQAFRQSFN